MKATTWLFPVLTLLCATRLVCTAQRGTAGRFTVPSRFPIDLSGSSNMLLDNYLLEKRNKPSLSIVNPLDVLRQRLLLEIARRQMKENTRQVELNRAILKNVGKRIPTAFARNPVLLMKAYQQQQQQQYHHPLPSPLQQDYSDVEAAAAAAALYGDGLLQRPMLYNGLQGEDAGDDLDTIDGGEMDGLIDDGKNISANKYQLSGNEIENGTANRKERIAAAGEAGVAAVTASPSTAGNDESGEPNDGYQLRYLYRLHKNHSTKM